MKKTNTPEYRKPELVEDVTCVEPVETGCCLRSCGGSPHHLNSPVSKELLGRFKNLANNSQEKGE